VAKCGDWLLYYALTTSAEIHVRYPSWKQWAFDYESDYAPGLDKSIVKADIQIVDDTNTQDMPVFDAVFVCRSGAWVPSWCDPAFFKFLDQCPLTTERIEVGPIALEPRSFNEDAARLMGEQHNMLMEQANASNLLPVESNNG
jgi:hypothetical protein